MRGSVGLALIVTIGGCNQVLGLDEPGRGDDPGVDPHVIGLARAPTSMAIGDLDGDLDLDVVVAVGDSSAAQVTNQTTASGFAVDAGKLTFAGTLRLDQVALVPQLDDGLPDLLFVDNAGGAYRGANDGGVLSDILMPVFMSAPGARVLVGDYEPAVVGRATVLDATPGGPTVRMHGVVGPTAMDLGTATVHDPFRAWAAGSITNDAFLDLVIATDLGVGVYLGQELSGPNLAFVDADVVLTSLTAPIAIGDLDGDGVADVIARAREQNAVLVLFGDGAGGFVDQLEVALDFAPTALAVVDLDGDLRGDLYALGPDGAETTIQSVRTGDRDSVAYGSTQTIHGQLVDAAAADFDGDGGPDLAVLLALGADRGELHLRLQR